MATFGTTIGSGGFRLYDARHEVSHNYVQGIYGGKYQGSLLLDSGDAEGSSTNLSGHWRVVNATVERNVIVACPEGIRFGHNYSMAPTGCTVQDNVVVQAASGTAVTTLIAPVSTTQARNTYYATPAAGGLVADSVSIWRKSGYGPRLTYLQASDVGINGDPGDTDGTGTLVGDVGTPPAGGQTVTAVGIPTGQAFGYPTVTGGAEPTVPAGSHPTLLGIDTVLPFTLGYTGSGTPGGSGGQTISLAGRIPSGQAFGLPLVTVADGPQTVRAIGIASASVFGRPTVDPGIPPDPAPGGYLVPSVYAVAADGVTLTPLPHWSRLSVSPQRNSMGAISADYPAGADGFSKLNDAVSAYPLKALEIRVWLGGNATGALGGWLVQKEGDDLTPGSSWTFTGHFHEWLLSKALVAPQPKSAANEKGELLFASASAGLVLKTVMDQAQARGALPLVTRDWDETHDSNGLPWPTSVSSLSFAPKTTVQQVADKLVELGMVEYELTAARVWRAYVPGTMGEDKTLGQSPLTFAHAVNLREHSRRESAKDAGTAVLAAGSEGFYAWAESATATAQLGWRAEVAADAGQLASETAVQAVAATTLEAIRNGVAEYVGGVEFDVGKPLPFINFGVGDWAFTWVGNTRRRLRIAQIGLEFAPGQSPKGTVALNDLISDKVSALYRRLNAITSGDAVVGTSTSTSGGSGEDRIPPSAPTGLTLSSTIAYRVPDQASALALVTAGWAPVVTDAYADVVTADKATAAVLIAARMRSGQPIDSATWLWDGYLPRVVTEQATTLREEFKQAHPNLDFGTTEAPAPIPDIADDWLRDYPLAHQGQGAVTGDVEAYVLQYTYLGAQPLTDQQLWEISQGLLEDNTWIGPEGSPVSDNTLTFGNIEGGRTVGVRVAAVDRAGNQGPWSPVVAVDTAADDLPPPVPSRPSVSTWFRTMDITWDGKGSSGEDMLAAAPDFASGGGLEIHVAQGIDFLPDRPVVDGKVDLSLSSTYRATLYAASTWNVADLTIGTTYFARFVAVDRVGNASEPSETSDGVLPKQLVNIDIGPGAIARQQIIDGEIVRAKIADLAVNNAKIEDLSVGKLTAGTMTAQVVVGGRFSTPTVNGNRIEFDGAGIRLIQSNSVVGRWQVSDASMLVTGTYLSGLNGERINILPDGSMRIYGAAGVDYGELANDGGAWKMTSRADSAGRRSRVDFDPGWFQARYGTSTETRSEVFAGITYATIKAPVTGARVLTQYVPTDATVNRFFLTHANASGDIGTSVLHYMHVDSRAVLTAPINDCGIRWAGGPSAGSGRMIITDGLGIDATINHRELTCRSVTQTSTREGKRDITDALDMLSVDTAKDLVRRVRAKAWKHRSYDAPGREVKLGDDATGQLLPTPPEQVPTEFGFVAEDLLEVVPELVHGQGEPGGLRLAPMEMTAVVWESNAEAHDGIDALTVRMAAVEAALNELKPKGPPSG